MKKILLFLITILVILHIAKGQEPIITMTTAKTIGSNIYFFLVPNANNSVQVDFGNGTLVNKTLSKGVFNEINGTIIGSQTIKVYGTGITQLQCISAQLTSLDVSKNTALTTLECTLNQLTTLDVTKNTALTSLYCGGNQLSKLDVTKNTTLTYLQCCTNQLTSLDVTKNILLLFLSCGENQLTSLDVTKNTALTDLECESNQLTSLDATQNIALLSLFCNSNKFTSLDVTKNAKLFWLWCSKNQLTTLDVTKNTALSRLWCRDNQLNTISFAQNTALLYLYCDSNKLKTLDVTKDAALIELKCGSNQLTTLDVSQNIALTELRCDSNQLTTLDVTKNTALNNLYCTSNQLTSLDVTKNTQLSVLRCESNQLTFVTLPFYQNNWMYFTYAPQKLIQINKNINVGYEINLSTQYLINSDTTSYTWKTQRGATLIEGVDYTQTNGKTVFLKTQTDSVTCEMTNATFPDLTGTNVLKTTYTKVLSATAIESKIKQDVELYENNKTLFVKLPYNAQLYVFDTNGRLIVSKPIYYGTNIIQLQNSGIYILKIVGNKEETTKKLFLND